MDDKILLKTFGLNLKFERLKKGLSQEMVAEAMDMSSVYISNVESGKHKLSLVNAYKLCSFFGKTVEYMLTEKD